MTEPILNLMARLLVAYRNGTGSRVEPEEVQALLTVEPFAETILRTNAHVERLRAEKREKMLAGRTRRRIVTMELTPDVAAEITRRNRTAIRPPVSLKMAKAIREARLAGMTYRAICKTFDVGMDTARRHASDINARRMKEYQRKRRRRIGEEGRVE